MMNTNTMKEYIDDDAEETLSLSNFLMDEYDSSQELSQSSSSPTSDQDFMGFSSEEWSPDHTYDNYNGNIIFCGKVLVSTGRPLAGAGDKTLETKSLHVTSPLFRSNSDSFRVMRLKTASRSKSLPNRSTSFPCKSRVLVFMFGSGSAKFPTKIDMSEIKNRQLRHQSTMKILSGSCVDGGKEKSGKRGWWRLVDVLGCGGGGFERELSRGGH